MNRGKRRTEPGLDLQAELEALIEEITVDAYDDDEKLWAFRQAFEDNIGVPCAAVVIGEPVSVIEFDYDGNNRRGLTAKCRRADGSEHVVAVCDVVFAERSAGRRYIAAYRMWLGIKPFLPEILPVARHSRAHKRAGAELDVRTSIELVVLSVKEAVLRCRIVGGDKLITVRASRRREMIPGEIVSVDAHKQWSYSGHDYLSGGIERWRLDVAALGLVPLRVENRGVWDPREEYWGEDGEPIEEWAKPIIARGPRQSFEMEQVLPGADADDPFADPITEANDLRDAGDLSGAREILMKLCEADLRCLDAHAHLGNLAFDHRPEDAIRHYEVGLRIGELSLSDDFEGVLLWGHIDNRSFLRCMHSYGLCLWRLERFEEAECLFDRMLWLNPTDNQGVRGLIDHVRAHAPWEESRED